MSSPRALTIRQFNRLELDLPLILRVADEHAQQVMFSRTSGTVEGQVKGRAVDLSSGGLGAVTDWFLPRMCEGEVTVLTNGDGDEPGGVLMSQRVKVRRVSPTASGDTYALGLAFLDTSEELVKQIEAIQLHIDQADSATAGIEEPHHG